VAEDNPMNMMLISQVLLKMGYIVLEATNGKEVLEIATTQDLGLIFMDVNMPEMDGLAATEAIRGLPAPKGDVIIVALTADAMKEDKEICLAAGMNDYIAKPFRLIDIEAILKKYIVKPHNIA
jgi:CheY-like chemotaxis protein